MDWKRFFITFVVALVALGVMDYIVNMVLLKDAYEPLKGTLFRTDAEMSSRLWALFVAEIIFVFMFVWIYTYGVRNKGAIEGFRYGLYVGLLLWPISCLGMWVTLPITAWLAWMWAVFGLVQMIILGVIVGAIYKRSAS